MLCPQCATPNADEAWFCSQCGHQLEAKSLEAFAEVGSLDEQTLTMTEGEPHVEGGIGQLRIEIQAGIHAGRTIVFDQDRVVIGSHPQADLRIEDTGVSRFHAEIWVGPDGPTVVDLGSKNGTKIDGKRVRRSRVFSDTVLSVGPAVLNVIELRRSSEIDKHPALARFLSQDPRVEKTLQLLSRVADSNTTVLIEGETGVGKDLLARCLHDASNREGPFVVVDCGAIAPALLESQLFGHRRGAFTGAHSDQVGAFEHAQGGTIFLDEVGELPASLQPKLLRALEARTFRRLGEVEDRPFNARFVAATHRNLSDMVEQGSFRQDLFYRLAVIQAHIPPLRARRFDLPILAEHFLHQLSDDRCGLAAETHAVLNQHDWPGNARELRNVLERAVAIAPSGLISSDLIQLKAEPLSGFPEAKERVIASFERSYVSSLLEAHKGNVSQAAKDAGISRPALYALIKRTGLDT